MTRQLRRFVGFMLLVLLAAGCGGLSSEPEIVGALPTSAPTAVRTISLPQTAPDLALGAQVYAENCTRCHGASGQGDGELVQSGQVPAPIDFTDATVPHSGSPLDWYEVVTNGRLDKLMPPWGDSLSEAERWAVTMYVYTLPNTPDRIAEGEGIWAANCAECHGETGEGTDKGAPLPNLLQVSDAEALTAITDGIVDKMSGFADTLSADERAAVLAYARTLSLSAAPVEVAQAATAVPAEAPTGQSQATESAVEPPISTQEVGATLEIDTSVTGIVGGTVVNQTAGGSVPSDLTLTLHVFSSTDTLAEQTTLTATVNPDGTYQFADVPISASLQYIVTTAYQQAVFSSQVVSGSPANPQLDIPLNIYEVTSDPADIVVDGILTMVQPNTQPNTLEVVQIISFSNTSDRVFLHEVDSTPASVSIQLPAGTVYQDFSGGSYIVSADGREITDTQPVLPGESHVMHVAFTVPYNGQATIDQPLDYALDGQVEIMAGSSDMSISGDGISTLGTRQMGSSSYVSYGGVFSRAAGTSLRYDVTGSTVAQSTGTASQSSDVSTIAYVLIGAGLLAIGAAFGFFMRDRTSPGVSPATRSANEAPAPAPESNPEAAALVQQIADLDVRYQEGKLSQAKYQKQRSALKKQLVMVMKDRAQTTDDEA